MGWNFSFKEPLLDSDCGCQYGCRYCFVDTNCSISAVLGNIEMLRYLKENGFLCDGYTCLRAVSYGNIEVLKYLHENKCPWDERSCIEAASNGEIDSLKYLHENGCPWHKMVCQEAVSEGNLECLEYSIDNGCPWDCQELIYRISFCGDMEKAPRILAYLEEKNRMFEENKL